MDYNKQAENFLTKTQTTLKIERATKQKSPLWAKKGEKHGINYTCTLSNKNHTYTFDFWNSIRNREIIEAIQNFQPLSFNRDSKHFQAEDLLKKHNIVLYRSRDDKARLIAEYEPKPYDILSSISPLYEDTLEDFCSSFGYDPDSRLAEATFNACKEQDRNLRKLFDRTELELLAEIN